MFLHLSVIPSVHGGRGLGGERGVCAVKVWLCGERGCVLKGVVVDTPLTTPQEPEAR